MSCITEILAHKGDKEFIKISEGMVIEDGGKYNGYEYLITFVNAHRCGYVALPSDHPFNDSEECDYLDDWDVQVHGGITFNSAHHIAKEKFNITCPDRWIGFDAAHYLDHNDYEAAKRYGTATGKYPKHLYGRCVRSKDYMIKECKSLIDQLIQVECKKDAAEMK